MAKAPTARKKPIPPKKKLGQKKGVLLRQLLENTPDTVIRDSTDVKILKRTTGITSTGMSEIWFRTMSEEPTTARRPPKHDTVIRMYPNGRMWISCSCEFFMYRLEYALWKHGASNIMYSNGEPAVTTNPRNVPYCCKHIYKVLRRKATLETLKSLLEK